MGIKDAFVPLIFFIICIFGIAQSSITVKTYLETGKEKDNNFNFSAVILTASILGLLGSGFMAYKAFKGPGMNVPMVNVPMGNVPMGNVPMGNAASEAAGSQTNISNQQLTLADKLENMSANAAARAAKASEGAKLANALGATLGQLKNKTN
jgi:hypothetical protein